MIYLCATKERLSKSRRLMEALAKGFELRGETCRLFVGAPPDDMDPFIVWGQIWLAADIIPLAIQKRRPFWQIDNGYVKSARGSIHGYYRFTYRSMSPVLLPDMPEFSERPFPVSIAPWRTTGKHIMIALPGMGFGKAFGLNLSQWVNTIQTRVKRVTKRPIMVREKSSRTPLSTDLQNCWALVTHSSNVAVDAVLSGVPVFVEPTSAAAPVGRCDLDLEHPHMPNRTHWANSLFAQQYTIDEMADGTAYDWMMRVVSQVDGSPTARKEVHYDRASAS